MSNRVPAELAVVLSNTVVEVLNVVVVKWSVFLLVADALVAVSYTHLTLPTKA